MALHENDQLDAFDGLPEPIEKSAPTKADESSEAAAGGQTQVNITELDFQTPNRVPAERRSATASIGGIIILEPPEDPGLCYSLYRKSAYLYPAVAAILTNVYATGYNVVPRLDLDREDIQERIRAALAYERSSGDLSADARIGKRDLKNKLKAIRKRMELEYALIHTLFEQLVPDMTWDQLRMLVGEDLEVTGNAYCEAMRGPNGKISRIQWLPSTTMRVLAAEPTDLIPCRRKYRAAGLEWKETEHVRSFHRYVQLATEGQAYPGGRIAAYFKENGDPRVLSRTTGKYYDTYDAFLAAEWKNRAGQKPLAATEVIHFRIPYAGSTIYGKPRWSGHYAGIYGGRKLDEENLKFIGDEAVPSIMLLISGGTIGSATYERLTQALREREKGRKSILVVEARGEENAVAGGPIQQPTLKTERLRDQQTNDALFSEYDKRVEDKAYAMFRMPRALLGKDLGQNRATTLAMLRFADEQVFQPIADEFDRCIESTILSDRDIAYQRYATKRRVPRDPEVVAGLVRGFVDTGILSPNEGRDLIGEIFNSDYDRIDRVWGDIPPRFLTVLLQTKNQALATALSGEASSESLEQLSQSVRGSLGLDTATEDDDTPEVSDASSPPNETEGVSDDSPGSE